MFLQQLSLSNFRNYPQLELELHAPIVIFQGDNGQGKTNLLEAVYFLATTRSLRASSDRELVHWRAMEEAIPFARVAGTVRRSRGDLKVEVVIRADRVARAGTAIEETGSPGTELSKRIKINGVVKRALDLIGQINVVMFSPQDMDLIAGAPALRRRYLDISDCQVDPRYCRALQQYNRVLAQRNHLLKQIRDGRQPPETLEFWSDELTKAGSYLLARRIATVEALDGRIDGYHRRLTGSGKTLKMVYRSSVEEALWGRWDVGTGIRGDGETRGRGGTETGGHGYGETAGSPPRCGEGPGVGSGDRTQHSAPRTQNPERSAQHSGPQHGFQEEVERQQEMFREALRRFQRREVLHGVSMVGPHRDDLVFRTDGIDVNVYGSRGEQRAVALALKLSEVEFMEATTGERPILLLDDVMSELDPSRRHLVLRTLSSSGQTLITATDLQSFSPDFLSRAALYQIRQGSVTPFDSGA